MSNEQSPPLSIPAGSDLSASQFCGVTINSSGQLVLPSAGARILGILYTKPAAQGRPGTVETQAGKKLRAKYGGTVTAADPVKVDAAGKFVTAVSTNVAVGVAYKSGVNGDVGEIVLMGPFVVP
jgi:hypothetical protein